jgi:pSer/pThr/pTyr-binding forkhead associated (FHA) protein
VAAKLIWTRPGGEAVEFALENKVLTVGREADADLRVNEPLVSRAHARLEPRGAAWFVVDLGSTNLTRVNGDVVGERELRDGDEIRFGRAQCRFAAEGA